MSIHMRFWFFPTFFVCTSLAAAQTPDGRAAFQNRCAVCHGTDGNGGEHAPSILARAGRSTEPDLIALMREGIPARGMPGFTEVPEPELRAIAAFAKSIVPPAGRGGRGRGPAARVKLQTTDGKSLEGIPLGSTSREIQLRTDDGRIHLLRKSGEQVSRSHLPVRLVQLSRRLQRQSLYRDDADQ